MVTADLKARVSERVDARAGALDELAFRIHERPELAFQERFASTALADHLAGEGATVTRGAGGLETAFVAEIGSGAPVVAILGEYDALPGLGHACGHNLMGTAASLAFLALRDVAPELRGRVRIVGCPAEERGNGKVKLIRAGMFSDVDAALMYHPGDRDELDPLMLAMVTLDIEFTGKAAHAAAEPDQGRNALDAVMLAWTAISALRLTIRSDSRIHGIITDGGKAANIIPDRSAATFMVRSPDNAYLTDLRRRVLACFEGAAAATGCELHDVERRVRAGEHEPTARGSVLRQCEGAGPADEAAAGHSTEFAAAARTPQALETMHVAAKALAMTAIDVLRDDKLRVRAKEAFVGQRH